MTEAPAFQPETIAAIDLIGHTGASDFQIRYSDDEEPVVWMAVATYEKPSAFSKTTSKSHQVDASLDPEDAIFRLAERLIDGGVCQHCGRPTALLRFEDADMPPVVCAYQYDPELKKYRRSCEGDT